MTPELLDTALNTYLGILTGAFGRLSPYGQAILFALAALELRWAIVLSTLDGYLNLNSLFGMVLALAIRFAVLLHFIRNAAAWANNLYADALTLGAAASPNIIISGVSFPDILRNPGTIVRAGLELAFPMISVVNNYGQILSIESWWVRLLFLVVYVLVVILFSLVALFVLAATLEFFGAAVASVIFLAWMALRLTSAMGWGVLHWLGANFVRLFLVGVMLGGAFIILATFPPLEPTFTRDPQIHEAVLLLVLTGIMIGASIGIPTAGAAAMMGSTGMGLRGLLLGGMVGVTAVRTAAGVVRGFSNLVRR